MSRRISVKQKRVQERWSIRLSEWEQSGLSQSKYCRDNNLNLRNFQYWKSKYKKLNHPETPNENSKVKIVQIKNKGIASEQFNLLNDSNPIKLIINNIKVELNNHFSEEALKRLIKVLKTI